MEDKDCLIFFSVQWFLKVLKKKRFSVWKGVNVGTGIHTFLF